jgi:hypothetical protein
VDAIVGALLRDLLHRSSWWGASITPNAFVAATESEPSVAEVCSVQLGCSLFWMCAPCSLSCAVRTSDPLFLLDHVGSYSALSRHGQCPIKYWASAIIIAAAAASTPLPICV